MGFWEDSSAPVQLDRKGRVERERAGLSVVAVVLLVLALLCGVGYAAAHSAAGDRVPRGTTVSGVALGGLTRAAAIARLEDVFAARAHTPILLAAADATGADRTVSILPAQVGLSVDAAASVDQTDPRRSWRPQRLWDYFSDGAALQAVARVDSEALAARIRTMAGGFGGAPIDARIVFTPRGVQQVRGQAGDAVSLDAAVAALETAYVSGARRAEVPLVAAQPDIDQTDLDAALASFARPAMSAPVTLVLGRRHVTLTPRRYAGALAMVARDGHLVPQVHWPRLLGLLASERQALAPRDASVAIVHGRPVITPPRPGTTYPDSAVVAAFRAALTAHGRTRTGVVAGTDTQPAFTEDDARALGITRPIASFAAHVPPAEGTRVAAVAARLDGRVLRPGALLRLQRGAGPVAAAVFGAAFLAGLADATPRLPVVLDPDGGADVPAGTTFRVDGSYGALLQVTTTPARRVRPGLVRVTVWSTKQWRVSVRRGARTRPVSPPTRTDHGRGCRPRAGAPGYTVAITRTLHAVAGPAADPAAHVETFHAVTAPVDRVVCR